MLVPPALKAGSRVHVIAPSGPFDRCLVLRGMAWLAERFRLTFRQDLFARRGFLAGSDERRLTELSDALLDPEISAIVTARGGHGLIRIAHAAPFDALRHRPKWLIGFSDPTVLHCESSRVGVASLHGANVAGLGRADDQARQLWLSALQDPLGPRTYQGVGWSAASVRGQLVGGNLTVLATLAAAGRLHVPEGCILAIEDVSESSYRVDRMLTALRLGGYLERAAGFALGQFTDCSPGPYRVPVEDVLLEQLSFRPTVGNLPFGHDLPNAPLTFGSEAVLDASRGTLTTPAPS